MNILLASATALEIAPFVSQLQSLPMEYEIDVLVTGIGLTAATYSLTRQLVIKRPDLVIQAGIAGCFDQKVKLGTVLLVKKDIIADQLVIEKNQPKTLFDLGLLPANKSPYQNRWLVNKNELLKKLPLKKVNAISINEITTSKRRIAYYQGLYKPVIESMEGAALHYTCLMENLPFLQIRSVSNYVGVRDKKKWDFAGSIRNLNNQLLQLLPRL